MTFHAGPSQQYFPANKCRLLAPLFKLLFRLPQAIVCNSEAVKKCIVGYKIDPSRVFPIPAFSKQYLNCIASHLPEELREFAQQHEQLICTYFMCRD